MLYICGQGNGGKVPHSEREALVMFPEHIGCSAHDRYLQLLSLLFYVGRF